LKNIDDVSIALEAMSLNNYLQTTKKPTEERIRDSLKRIDPDGTGYADDEVFFRLLLKAQKQYKLYARRWQTSFRKWIKEAYVKDKGCYYASIFLNHSY
jgi:Ca2+-binding EF-hand superfamily protein